MEKEALIQILERISNGDASDEDIRQYNSWCNEFQDRELYLGDFEDIKASLLADIEKQINSGSLPVARRLWPRIAVAASIVLVLLVAGYSYLHYSAPVQSLALSNEVAAPGGDKAILTLANGQTILLDSLDNGQLDGQAGNHITKPANGLLVYSREINNSQTVHYNTLTTPRGGKYKLILSDSTIVWLNAASSIRYPTNFNGTQRTVRITGEAYFEVVHNEAKPFTVNVMGQTIVDLGTKFDINAYGDEPVVKTTLLHGSVAVIKGNRQVVLIPGQQAVVSNNNNEIQVHHVNTENTVAWVSGFMSLDNIAVKELMLRLSRWYNVDIVYSGAIPDIKFGGMINRNAGLTDVLAILKANGINTELEGKKIIVLPN